MKTWTKAERAHLKKHLDSIVTLAAAAASNLDNSNAGFQEDWEGIRHDTDRIQTMLDRSKHWLTILQADDKKDVA